MAAGGLALSVEPLDGAGLLPDAVRSVLAGAAGERADAFVREQDRSAFTAGRVALLLFAAGLLDADPARLTPRYDCPQCGPDAGHGRPAFLLDGGPAPLLLSASRAAGRVLLAGVAHPEPGVLLGVDLEDSAGLAAGGPAFDAAAFTARERAWLHARPPEERGRGRARLWARKEAWLKHSGEGLRRDPATVDVLDRPGLRDVDLELEPQLKPEPPAHGLVAAVALF